MTDPDVVPSTPLAAAQSLNRAQFRRYLQAQEAESALQRGEQPPSALGRLWKPAETERKLVLFTLGIIVILIVLGVLCIEMWADDPSSAVTTTLVTVAGTGLGFIGGMVADTKSPRRAGDTEPEGQSTDANTGG